MTRYAGYARPFVTDDDLARGTVGIAQAIAWFFVALVAWPIALAMVFYGGLAALVMRLLPFPGRPGPQIWRATRRHAASVWALPRLVVQKTRYQP